MTGAARLAANRANARLSTGPRTAAGKARSSRNRLRHGLSLPLTRRPGLAEEAHRIARQIAGDDPVRWPAARDFAEAHVQLQAVRRVKAEAHARAGAVDELRRLDRYERSALFSRNRAERLLYAPDAFVPMRPPTARELGIETGPFTWEPQAPRDPVRPPPPLRPMTPLRPLTPLRPFGPLNPFRGAQPLRAQAIRADLAGMGPDRPDRSDFARFSLPRAPRLHAAAP